MPELPEVETFRLRFERNILHRRIEHVTVIDNKVLRGVSILELKKELTGHSFTKTYRRGKYFFAKLSSQHWLHIHLGMTGEMEYFDAAAEPPTYSRVILEFEKGPSMAYVDMRKFGSFYPIHDLDTFLIEKHLGPDALSLSEQEFLDRLSRKKGNLKAVLLSQSVLAGLGNLYIDEICLQTRVHPGSRTEQIPPDKLKEIYQVMIEILSASIDRHAKGSTYPTSNLWSWRERGYTFPDGRGPVHTCTLAGRTTCTVPDQVKY
jgi:formamidopyrimidine-DNA glycosylase